MAKMRVSKVAKSGFAAFAAFAAVAAGRSRVEIGCEALLYGIP